VNEGTFRTGPACSFQQIQCPDRVDVKIVEGAGRRQIVAGLSRGVNDCVRSDFRDDMVEKYGLLDKARNHRKEISQKGVGGSAALRYNDTAKLY
jgi:hypothetical protein